MLVRSTFDSARQLFVKNNPVSQAEGNDSWAFLKSEKRIRGIELAHVCVNVLWMDSTSDRRNRSGGGVGMKPGGGSSEESRVCSIKGRNSSKDAACNSTKWMEMLTVNKDSGLLMGGHWLAPQKSIFSSMIRTKARQQKGRQWAKIDCRMNNSQGLWSQTLKYISWLSW